MASPFFTLSMVMMNKRCYLILVAAAMLAVSCGDSKKKDPSECYLRPPSLVFTPADTSSINKLVDTFVDGINKRDLSSASSMLYRLDKGMIENLPIEKRLEFESLLSKFPLYGCEVFSFSLTGQTDNKIELAVKVMPDADVLNGKGVIKLVLNPVMKDGQWYLTLRDNDAEGIENDGELR